MVKMLLLVPLLLLVLAMVFDLRTREIPDWISMGLVGMAMVAAVFGLENIRWWMVLSGGLLGLIVGAALFRYAELGGGDAKLIVGVGTLLGPVGLLIALFWMALAGGVLALIAMFRGQRDYAYAPAIAAGFAGYLIYPVGILQDLWDRA
jgi:prepilin peptidase CpaA